MRYKTLLLLFPFLVSQRTVAQSWDELVYQGREAHARGELQHAVDLLAQAADKKGQDNFELYLYAGILSARLGSTDESFSLLRKSVDAGMWDVPRLERNSRLADLRSDQRWDALVERIHDRENEYVEVSGMTHPRLREELKSMWAKDQNLAGSENQRSVIDDNSKRLHEIVSEYGWPTESMVGKDGAWFAWAIAQHSFDIDFQRECLSRMESLLHAKKLDATYFAELSDRIARNTGEDQKYGMAIVTRDGGKVFYPIADIESVDERRSEIGLPPLKVWANENGVDYE